MIAPAPADRPAAAAAAFREAHEPPEARGLERDAVRLLVATRSDGHITHARFRDLPELLAPGDLLVVNTSATLPAAIAATDDHDRAIELRFATRAPDAIDAADATPAHFARDDTWWVVELRTADGSAPLRGDHAGRLLGLAGGAYLHVCAPYAASTRLWLARYDGERPVVDHLARYGHPIRYGYVHGQWPIDAYQTAYARQPGSAEMPSAGRPFTPELITRLVAGGVLVAPLTLHCGVSSLERHEAPYPEPYEVPPATARLVNATRAWGGHVIAVGTTVVRALETVADDHGVVHAGSGWTRLVVTPKRGVHAVDGLLTGWHEPEASHLLMLEAIAGPELLERSYAEARASGYLWHEFGDSHLILP